MAPPPAASAPAAATIALANTSKRDFLIAIEKKVQAQWAADKVFEANSPYLRGQEDIPTDGFTEKASKLKETKPKWMGTFPYPYMNGSLHLGHAFTISKIEFAAGFERMRGKEVLWPVGFHCTGMPIKAAADKLIREMEMFGEDFAGYKEPTEEDAAEPAPSTSAPAKSTDPSKAKKGKLTAKSTGLKYQFQIMRSIGVPVEEIKKFADTAYWLEYFPPIATKDITEFGGRVDWRRSFLTTPANPYYDAFVRWQMNKLHKLGYIKFGKRYTIYSAKDGQPCMDHDRSSGEGVGPQEYTGLLMPLVSYGAQAGAVEKAAAGKKVVLVAATLRPETMYGQTNCFLGPEITYGLWEAKGGEDLWVMTARAARNAAYQGLLKVEDQVPTPVATFKGKELMGSKVKGPNAVYDEIYVVPMETVLATKGTGVVSCVPSDSPDDWITTLELRKKAEYYGIDPSWVSLEPISVLNTPAYGDLTAVALIEKLKIRSPKDTKQLLEAKEISYKEGFYGGTMTIGPFKGAKVEDAKIKVREQLIADGLAVPYSEPEGMVMSRSGDECIVALCDQWYLDYGEPAWRAKAEKLLSKMNCYSDETRNGFEGVLAWLRQWACSRSYGLGSKLPWDPQFLVESLSDSTIYMAYYTIAHLLHGPPVNGSKVGPLGIKAEQMTDEIWDYIYSDGAFPDNSPVPLEAANKLKAEFSYFYPMDIRSSGKDLIPNHLSFCIYVHAALFREENWPLSMRANGHLMLNGEKMSKSTGNFLTLKDATEKFGADASRLSLADAGDTIEDANFDEATANAAILRLRTLIEWCEESVQNKDQLRTGEKSSLWDKIFENEMNLAIEETYALYDAANYKEALKTGFYNLLIARDSYRDATAEEGGMHVDLVMQFIRVQTLLVTPIVSHVAEHLWQTVLQESTSVQFAQWPKAGPVDKAVIASGAYLRTTVKNIRDSQANFVKKAAKGKALGTGFDPTKPFAVQVWVSPSFPAWQDSCVAIVKSSWTKEAGVDDKKVREELTKSGLIKDKRAMPFVAQFKKRIADLGPDVAFNRTAPFDELPCLNDALPYLRRTLQIESISIADVKDAQDGTPAYSKLIVDASEPGSPGIVFYNV